MGNKSVPKHDDPVRGDRKTLSVREWQIADLYAGGSTYKEIAENLHRSPATVRSHLATIFRKLDVSSKAGLIHALAEGQAKDEAQSSEASRGKPTIAVLPFNNISDDPSLEYLCDGISEDIITELSRFSNLSVIARNSSFFYKGSSFDVRQVAEALDARYLLEGSLRVTGHKLRITAQLLDSQGAAHVWAEKYDCALSDIVEKEDFFVRSIVCNISPHIEVAELNWARGLGESNLSGYALAMKALAIGYEAVRDANRERLDAALLLCSGAAQKGNRNIVLLETRALLLMYRHIYAWGEDPASDLADFHQAAETLIRLDSQNAKGYLLRGWAAMYRGNFDAAVVDHNLALSLNPNLSSNIFAMAWTEAVAGQLDEAEAHVTLGLQLNPRETDIWIGEGYAALAVVHLLRGNADKALHCAHLANQLQPAIRSVMVVACQILGDKNGVALHLSELQDFAPKFVENLVSGKTRLFRQKQHNQLLLSNFKNALKQ